MSEFPTSSAARGEKSTPAIMRTFRLKRFVLARPAVLSRRGRPFDSPWGQEPSLGTRDTGVPAPTQDKTAVHPEIRALNYKHKAYGFAVTRARMIRGPGRLVKRKISWEASPTPSVVGYRVYWAVGRQVTYDSPFADVGHSTSFTLPDDLPSFPLVAGRVEIGVTSLSRSGNESDMLVLSALFDFTKPRAPVGLKLENG